LRETSALDRNLEDIFSGSWDPIDDKVGAGFQGPGAEAKDQSPGPEVCWNYGLNPEPLGLTNMSEEEKQVGYDSILRARSRRD
jgi:PERQ amino acid-rich with GYF domain-containing protein